MTIYKLSFMDILKNFIIFYIKVFEDYLNVFDYDQNGDLGLRIFPGDLETLEKRSWTEDPPQIMYVIRKEFPDTWMFDYVNETE